MKISTEWLHEFVDLPSHDELAHIFEMAGAGVEDRTSNEDGEIFTLEVTSNRGDWLSVIGLAREIAAMTGARLRVPHIEAESTPEALQGRVSVEIENPEDCPRYVARLIEGVKVGSSPQWMQERLTACGMRPVNNVVDVTNYVMLETGQPLHAFDADSVSEGNILVRRAKSGEEILTLDDQQRALDEETMLVTDGSAPLAVAGVMGGANSEVSENTSTILLEAAHFSPARVRHGARQLAMQSEASRRFVRWVDPNGVLRAAQRAVQLLEECAGGKAVPGAIDSYPAPLRPTEVVLRPARCNALLGLDLSQEKMSQLLARLGLQVEADGQNLRVSTPTWRRDIEREIDLIEEIARVNGYDHIPTTLPRGAGAGAGRSLSQRLEEKARNVLLRCDLSEVVTYSLQSEADVERAGLQSELTGNPVKLRNPLSDDYTQMRTSLIPSLLGVLERNKSQPARIFEIGKVYLATPKSDAQPQERRRIGMAVLDAPIEAHWQKTNEPNDFFAVKSAVNRVLDDLGAPPALYRAVQNPPFHPGRCAAIVVDGEDIGVIGEIHPDVGERYNLEHRATLAIIDFDALVRHLSLLKQYRPIPKVPASDRDLALVLDESISSARVRHVIAGAAGDLLESQRIFDIYRGAPIPEGKKNLALSLRFRAPDRTLVDAEVDAAMDSIFAAVKDDLNAELRG